MNQENIQDIYEETNIEYISIPIKCYRRWDTNSLIFKFFFTYFSFNFIYYEVQSIIIDISLCGCFIYGFKR